MQGGVSDDQPVKALALDLPKVLEPVVFRVSPGHVRIVDDGVDVRVGQRRLHRAHKLRVVGAADVGNHQRDHIGLAGPQALRPPVRNVTKLVNCAFNPFAQHQGNPVPVIDHVGNRGERNACQLGNFLDLDHSQRVAVAKRFAKPFAKRFALDALQVQILGVVAGRELAWPHFAKGRDLSCAAVCGVGAARVKMAPTGRIRRVGSLSAEHFSSAFPVRIGLGDGRQ